MNQPTPPSRSMPVRRPDALNSMNMFSDANLEKLEHMVNQGISERSHMKLSEFIRYRPLYQHRSPHMSDDVYYALSVEFQARVSTFHPLKIVADHPNDDGSYTVLFTLPPIFTRVQQIPKQHADVPTIFSNVLNRPANPLSSDSARVTDLMIASIQRGNDPNSAEFKALQQEFNQIMAALDPTSAPKPAAVAAPTASAPVLPDDEWSPV